MMKIQKLKDEGHRLMDEYKTLMHYNSQEAYVALHEKMKRRQPAHFAQMRTEQEVKFAIGALKKMITAFKIHVKTK